MAVIISAVSNRTLSSYVKLFFISNIWIHSLLIKGHSNLMNIVSFYRLRERDK